MTLWLWIGFLVFVAGMLAIDLGVLNRKAHVVRAREAMAFTGICVALALMFTGVVYGVYEHDWLGMATKAGHAGGGQGRTASAQYLTTWLLEYSLSVDNLFVIAAIFASFGIPPIHQRRVLLWGVIGAIVMRAIMILLGAKLVARFDWIMYIFGALLLFSAVRMLTVQEKEIDWDKSFVIRILRKVAPISPKLDGGKFLTRLESGARALTPLAVVLVLVETADLIFAVDSIPAAFGVTQDPFLIFTSNVFAILGLRSLYFALAAIMGRFKYLKLSLVFVLGFLGVKLTLHGVYKIEALHSLAIIVSLLAAGIIGSVLVTRRELKPEPPLGHDVEAAAKVTIKYVRKVAVIVVGSIVLLAGVVAALPAVPGPGVVLILIGLAILATQFRWAGRLLSKVRDKARQAVGKSAKVVGMENSAIVKGAERIIDEVAEIAESASVSHAEHQRPREPGAHDTTADASARNRT